MSRESQQNFRSMIEALPMVKKMIADLVKTAPKIPTWVLISFKDPDVELVRKTEDVEELKTDLDALDFGGDPLDDLKEQALKGNLKSVHCPITSSGIIITWDGKISSGKKRTTPKLSDFIFSLVVGITSQNFKISPLQDFEKMRLVQNYSRNILDQI